MGANSANPYDRSFFSSISDWAHESAQEIVPIVMELVHPESVIDVGCGTGAWLAKFVEHGVTRYLGLDGDYVERAMLEIDPSHFVAADVTQPLPLGVERYDLAVSLEVAEHLPAECADGFVDSLARLAPVVLFSAAIPFQGGTNHINERWQGYWAERFVARGFVAVDAVRGQVWESQKVAPFYAQNIILYVDQDVIPRYPRLRQELESVPKRSLDLVHPRLYLAVVEQAARQSAEDAKQVEYYASNRHLSFSAVARMVPGLFARALLRKGRRVLSRLRQSDGGRSA